MFKENIKYSPHNNAASRIFKFIVISAIPVVSLLASTEYLWASSLIVSLGAATLTLITFEFLKSKSIEFVNTLVIPFSLLLLVGLALSSIGVPPFVLKIFNPSAFELYKDNLPSYPYFFNILPIKSISLYPYGTLIGLATTFSFFIIFFSLINKLDTFRLRWRMVNMIIISATVVACLGIINMFIQNKKLFWVVNIISGTPTGPFINTIHFASFMALCIPLTLGAWVAKIDFSVKYYESGRVSIVIYKVLTFIKNSVVYLLPVSLMILALFKALSRGAVISFFLSMFLFALLLGFKQKTRWRMFALLFFVVLFVFTTFAVDSFDIKSKILKAVNIDSAQAIFNQDVAQRLGTLKNIFETDSAKTRFSVWKGTLAMFMDFPVFGTGLNTFSVIFPKYKTIHGSGKMLFTHAENDYVETLSEIGFIGFALTLVVVLFFLINVFLNFISEDDPEKIGILTGGISSIFALLFCAVTDFSFRIPSTAFIFIVISFIVWPQAKQRKVLSLSSRKKIIFALSIAMAVILSLSLLAIKLLMGGLSYYKFSQSKGNFDAQKSYIKNAIFFNGSNADYYYALGKVYFDRAGLIKNRDEHEALRFIEQANTNFEKAINLQPTNWKYHFFNGSSELILASRGVKGYSAESAHESFDRALVLDPNEYEIFNYLGNYYLAADPGRAFQYYKKLISHKPYYLNSVLEIIWKVNNNIEFIREAVPDDPNLLINYANFLKTKGANGDKIYEEAAFLIYKLKNNRERYEIAARFAALGYFRQAIDCLMGTLELESYFIKNKNNFIIKRLSPNELVNEERDISRLQKISVGNDYELLYKLALFYYQLKDYNKALEYFYGLLKIRPDSPELRFKLALTLYGKGQYKGAYKELKMVIDELGNKE